MRLSLALQHRSSALVANYRHLQLRAATATGAAIKADAYGLGVKDVAKLLLDAGCRDFFVSTWWEAAELDFLPPGTLVVLHGFGSEDEVQPGVRPVLVTPQQVARWKASTFADEPCDVMVDTGMNRLGLGTKELGCLEGLSIHTLHSHLACADDDDALNRMQLERFLAVQQVVRAGRYSLANSAGIYLGSEFAFDLVRPGLALYGGIPRAEARGEIRQVTTPTARILQMRSVPAGESVGYNATFVAPRDMRVAVINIGYADGYRRAFSSIGSARADDQTLPVIGRVSMDLVTLDATDAPQLAEGDWVELSFDLEEAAAQTGISQYELLTGLGRRFQRSWI
ncbi:alanine racemase [Sphingomonas kaistensis]|uniref:alanine racemase n=1 Tax=Sphingomonas kaistensis TaxID=298708 RepID=A0ABZ2G539_9SPHN